MIGCNFLLVILAINLNNDTPKEVNVYQCKDKLKFELKETKEEVYITELLVEDKELYLYEEIK